MERSEKQNHARFEKIALEWLMISTGLTTRNRDSLDFHDVSVAGVRNALQAAYELGYADAKPRKAKRERKATARRGAAPKRTPEGWKSLAASINRLTR